LIQKYRREMSDRTLGLLAAAGAAAVAKLCTLLKSESEHVSLSAARAILENLLNYRNVLEVDERLRALEAAVAAGQAGTGGRSIADAARLGTSTNSNGEAHP
jgi:hypothetical protein